MKKIEIIKKALPILEKLEQDYVDGKMQNETNDWGRPINPADPTINEQLIKLGDLIRHARLAVKEAE